ncbi:hypothetical protein ACFWBB_00360 [Streptomyces sp. NPDC060000]|uniref:hypothetical protein n=1 Tax=Streptomyces sp. NPDC060000 TaxID=3347031 RepID=UPI0036A3BAF1
MAALLPGGTAVYPAFTDAGAAEPLHDADELTVQLGSVDPASPPGTSESRLASQDGAGRPVFVDESGRRSRRLRWLGAAIGVICSGYALVIVATLVSGNSSAPWLPLPGQGDDTPAAKVETSSVPSAPASPSGSYGAAPGAGTSASAATVSSAGGAAHVPGATASPTRPEASALPEASTTGTTTVNTTAPATTSGPTAPESAAASPEASQPGGGGESSPTAVEDTGGTGEVVGDANSVLSAG